MPDLVGLLRDRFNEVRMRVPEGIDGNARREIEVAIAVGRNEPRAFPALEGKIDARVGRQQVRSLGATHRRTDNPRKTKCAASPGGTVRYFIAARSPVNIRQWPRRQRQTSAAIHRRADK